MEHHPHNVLVTGGAGFIGCNFVRYLLATDPEVRIVNLDLLIDFDPDPVFFDSFELPGRQDSSR